MIMTPKPWDARIACALVRPLRHSRITPNHLTTLRLLVGLGAAAAYSIGRQDWSNWAAFLFILSTLLDHADGELARLTGKASTRGHYYDLFADAFAETMLFVGIGYGLRESSLGKWALPMGTVSGISVAVIFWLRVHIEGRLGKAAIIQPGLAGFEIEDVLYLLAPVTWIGWLTPFLTLAVVGAPAFALWTVREFRRSSSSMVPRGKV